MGRLRSFQPSVSIADPFSREIKGRTVEGRRMQERCMTAYLIIIAGLLALLAPYRLRCAALLAA